VASSEFFTFRFTGSQSSFSSPIRMAMLPSCTASVSGPAVKGGKLVHCPFNVFSNAFGAPPRASLQASRPKRFIRPPSSFISEPQLPALRPLEIRYDPTRGAAHTSASAPTGRTAHPPPTLPRGAPANKCHPC